MSVIRETRAGRLTSALLLSVSLAAWWFPIQAEPQVGISATAADALVRVQVKQSFAGIRYADQLLPYSTIIEVSEFSGAILDSRGYVAAYVGSAWTRLPEENVEFEVSLSGGRQLPARLIGIDERIALAVLEISGERRRAAVLGSLGDHRAIQVAAWRDGTWTQTRFEVASSHPSELDVEEELRGTFSRRPAAPDLEGSVLLDDSGRFLGFLTKSDRVGLSRNSQAIRVLPVATVRDSVKQIVDKGGSLRAGWLGVFIKDDTRRVEVEEVVEGGPAHRAGIQPGDLILKVGGRNIWSRNQFVRLVRWLGPGSQPGLVVERKGRALELSPTLQSWADSRPPATAWAMEIPKMLGSGTNSVEARSIRFYPVVVRESEDLGLAVEPVTPQLAKFFKVPGGQGLLIKAVLDQSLAGKMGFRAGDVLVNVNGSQMNSSQDLTRILHTSRDGVLEITFVREGTVVTHRVVAP